MRIDAKRAFFSVFVLRTLALANAKYNLHVRVMHTLAIARLSRRKWKI